MQYFKFDEIHETDNLKTPSVCTLSTLMDRDATPLKLEILRLALADFFFFFF